MNELNAKILAKYGFVSNGEKGDKQMWSIPNDTFTLHRARICS